MPSTDEKEVDLDGLDDTTALVEESTPAEEAASVEEAAPAPKKKSTKKQAKEQVNGSEQIVDADEDDSSAKDKVVRASDIKAFDRLNDQSLGDLIILARNKRFQKHVEGPKGKEMRAALANSPLVQVTLPYDPSNLKEKYQEFQMNTVLFRLPLGKPVMVPMIVEEFIRQTMYKERPNHEMLLVSA